MLYKNQYGLLINETVVEGCHVDIILLTDSTHAYVLEVQDKYYLYVTDIKNKRHVPELMEKFDTKELALTYASKFWSTREVVIRYSEQYEKVRNKPATERQIEVTKGNATTYGETTWYFAKSFCYNRMKNVVKQLLGKKVKTKTNELEQLKSAE
jgi:hypothetical protein